MSSMTDVVIALTGGGSGLGLGLARYFIQQGAKLAILEVVPSKVEALREQLGDTVLLSQGDVRSTEDLVHFHDAIVARFGGVGALVSTQGIFDGNRRLSDIPIEQIDQSFDEIMKINVLGYIKSAKIFYKSLAKSKGAIVFTASTPAAFAADGGGVLYTASKHAVLGVVRQLAFEFAPDIRVNGVAPCGIANSDLRGAEAMGLENEKQSDIPQDAFMSLFGQVTLLNHRPFGEEYGPLYALLAAPDSNIMTGEIVMADQGLMSRNIISPRSEKAS